MQNTFRPTRSQLLGLFAIALAVISGGLRDFVWADLRDGMISTKGFSRTTKLLVWLGFGLLITLIGVLIASNALRQSSPLLHNSTVAAANRGTSLPLLLAPFVMTMVAVSLSYILVGALHSHWLIRSLALVFALGIGSLYATMASQQGYLAITAVGLTLAVPVFFLLRWRAEARAGWEFGVLLALQISTALVGQVAVQQLWQRWHMPAPALLLGSLQGSTTYVLLPMLMLAGVDIANFVRQASGWTSDIVRLRLPSWAIFGALVGLLVWRLTHIIGEFADELATWSTLALAEYLGALGVPLLLLGLWFMVTRRASAPLQPEAIAKTGEARAFQTIVVYIGVLASVVLPDLLIVPLQAVLALVDNTGGMRALETWQTNYSSVDLIAPLRMIFFAFCVVLALWLARRGRRELALFLGAVGLLNEYAILQHPGQPFAALRYYGEAPVDFWLVLIALGCTLLWLARRTLHAERAGQLVFVLLVSGLLRQTAFIGDQFSPLYGVLGVGGVSVVAFGLVWGALTAGSWANNDSRALPRTGRVFLYVGVTLLTATLVILTQSSHNLGDIEQFGGNVAQTGLSMFGIPLLYCTILSTLVTAYRSRQTFA